MDFFHNLDSFDEKTFLIFFGQLTLNMSTSTEV